jgi:cytochrome c oxidase cbb3-type subunit IV
MSIDLIRGLVTALGFIAFVGVVLWAYSPLQRARFDAAARLALDPSPQDSPSAEESVRG